VKVFRDAVAHERLTATSKASHEFFVQVRAPQRTTGEWQEK
jgi:hypothetical protein